MKKYFEVKFIFPRILSEIEIENFSSFLFDHSSLGISECSLKEEDEVFALKAFFSEEKTDIKILDNLINLLRQNYPIFEVKLTPLQNEDWSKNWRKFFHKIKLGKRIIVLPPWEYKSEKISESALKKSKYIYIIIDPGMAFGTGTHETTQVCLEFMQEIDLKNKEIIDVGAGSGILSIAAIKLGAKKAIGIENDPEAIRNTKKNLSLNKTGRKIKIYTADAAQFIKTNPDKKIDIIICNMLMKEFFPIIPVMNQILKRKIRGGVLLSGYLTAEKKEVEKAMSQNGFAKISDKIKGEWAAGFFMIKR